MTFRLDAPRGISNEVRRRGADFEQPSSSRASSPGRCCAEALNLRGGSAPGGSQRLQRRGFQETAAFFLAAPDEPGPISPVRPASSCCRGRRRVLIDAAGRTWVGPVDAPYLYNERAPVAGT